MTAPPAWKKRAESLHHAASLGAFALSGAWWRVEWFKGLSPTLDALYSLHFGFTPLVFLALGAWLLGGGAGLRGLFNDGRWLWTTVILQLALWGAFVSSGAGVLNPEVGRGAAFSLALALFFALSLLCQPLPLRAVAGALMVGAGAQALLGFLQVAHQNGLGLAQLGLLNLHELGLDPQTSGVSVVATVDGTRYLRPYGLTAHPNLLAGLCLLGLWAAVGRGHVGVSVFLVWMLALSFSRAALGAAGVGLVVYAGLRLLPLLRTQHWPSLRGAWRPLILALCVGLAFVAFFHPLLLPRVGLQKSASPTFQTYSAAGRAVYQEQALALWAEHRWQGVGLGNFAWHSARLLQYDWRDLRGDHVHHLYLLAGVETGTIGLGLFLLSQALTFGLLGRRAWRGELDPIGAALAAGVVGWLAIGWFDHYPWTQFGYQLLFWGISACILGRKTHMPTPPSSK